jgi:hypothetical protein
MDMTSISSCNMSACAYNAGSLCHTRAINVGYHAECSTYVHGSERGGIPEVTGGIGACMTANCKFNNKLECSAPGIEVSSHQGHADCLKFKDRDSLE